MDPETRAEFDEQLDWVLRQMPPAIHELIEVVPLHVEDYPSAHVMQQMGVYDRRALCGLYTGIPLTQRSIEHSGTMPDVVTIYREGILEAARGRGGRITIRRLRKEIRVTLLHELAHHHGLDEDELTELGYG